MESQTFEHVFDALTDTPAEAANLKARSELMMAISAQVDSWNVPPEAAAQRLGITRPRLDELLRGKLSKFSLDTLVNLAAAAGLVIKIRVAQAA